MKHLKKIMAIILAVIMVISSTALLASCDREGGGSGGGIGGTTEKVDAQRTQLFIANYNGGGGSEWLNEIKTRFEAAYADVSFEEGKVGVQIFIDNHKTKGANYNINNTDAEVFFNEEVPYYDLPASALDLTDVVNEILAQEGVSMSDSLKASLTVDGKIYALPHYEFYHGLSYNKKVFDEEYLYIAQDGSYTNASGNLSNGPDGVAGTSDDGLPATIEEFAQLCAHMKASEVTPIIVSGQNKQWYATFVADAFAAAYDGYEGIQSMFSYDGGEIKVVTQMSNDRNAIQTETVSLTEQNGYKAWSSAGRAYALTLMSEFVKNGYFSVDGLVGTVSMTDAQKMFIESQAINKPIAMIAEGCWWENEADEFGSFGRVVSNRGSSYSRENSEFAFMPLPTKLNNSDTNNVSAAYINTYNSFAYVKNNISESKIELVKTFLKFCYSLESLQKYTQITGLAKGLEYEMPEEMLASMSTYQQSLWEIHESGNVVHQLSEKAFVRNGLTSYDLTQRWTTTTSGGYTSPFSYFDSVAGGSASDYFNGLKITSDKWNSTYLSK